MAQDQLHSRREPGHGAQGYYYYLHLLTKALLAARVDTLRLEGGREIRWRDEVARKLLQLQQPSGCWSNPEERWWEADKNLVTAYVVLSLEMLHSVPPGRERPQYRAGPVPGAGGR